MTATTQADSIKAAMKRAGCPLTVDQQMVLAGSLAVYTERDHIQDQLCARIEELEHDKAMLVAQLDQVELERDARREEVAQ